jgi:hypothetical protein
VKFLIRDVARNIDFRTNICDIVRFYYSTAGEANADRFPFIFHSVPSGFIFFIHVYFTQTEPQLARLTATAVLLVIESWALLNNRHGISFSSYNINLLVFTSLLAAENGYPTELKS